MAFYLDETRVQQSATKAAAEIVAAELSAGVIKSHDTAVKRFDEERARILAPLEEARQRDNAEFVKQESGSTSAPATTRRSGGGKGKSVADTDDPGSVRIKFGKFGDAKDGSGVQGLTVAEVYALSPEQAEEYGYVAKDGSLKAGREYIKWLSGNDRNPTMAKVATNFLELKRASSDE